MSASDTSIVWFRHDLRLADHPALVAAAKRGGPVIPVFIWAPEEEGKWAAGAASRWWLHRSLKSLSESLDSLGMRLTIRRGPSLAAIQAIAAETGADAVYWNRRYEPAIVLRDTKIKSTLKSGGLHVESFNGACLFEPSIIKNKQGKPFQVFSAFWRSCLSLPEPTTPIRRPSKLVAPKTWPKRLTVEALGLEPRVDWAGGIREAWKIGEAAAGQQLKRFVSGGAAGYLTGRDRPDRAGTSRLSPYLHFGELSPRQAWHSVRRRQSDMPPGDAEDSMACFLRELGWREFAYHLLVHFPHTVNEPLRDQFRAFPWGHDDAALAAWQRGQTGYPVVDAGMRELWTTGWMHNRVRMVVASFLVKHLLVDWRAGAAWFWDTLVDADLANNTLGWQWVAGCGADAAPYFRIFNPILQGRKFDPGGDYVRKWAPELAALPTKWIHAPWETPPSVLETAGIRLGRAYPKPIVDHATARKRALAALAESRQG